MTSRRYILTIFGITDEVNVIETFCTSATNVKCAAWQLEQGSTTNHPHIQLYIVCNKPVRMSQVKSWFKNNPHVEKCMGTHEDNVNYCTKDEGRINGPFYYPSMAEVLSCTQGARFDISDMFKMVKEGKSELEVAEANPAAYARSHKAVQRYFNLVFTPVFRDNIVCNVYYGAPGAGKSRAAWEEALAEVNGDLTKVYSKAAGDWWDGYNGQPIVVIDDFYGSIRYSELLKILDRYPLSVQIKGGHVSMRAIKFYITSNSHPRDWYSGIKDKIDLNALKRRISSIICFQIVEDGQIQKIPEDPSTQTWTQIFTPTTIPY